MSRGTAVSPLAAEGMCKAAGAGVNSLRKERKNRGKGNSSGPFSVSQVGYITYPHPR